MSIAQYMRNLPGFYQSGDFHAFIKSYYASKHHSEFNPEEIPVDKKIVSISAAPVPDPDWLDIGKITREIYTSHPHRYSSMRDKALAEKVVEVAIGRKLRCLNSYLRMKYAGINFQINSNTLLIQVIDAWIVWQMKNSPPSVFTSFGKIAQKFFFFWK